jgi:hypothetical protein
LLGCLLKFLFNPSQPFSGKYTGCNSELWH